MANISNSHLPALQKALSLQKSGYFQQAENAYRQVLASDPGCAKAHLLLGTVLAITNRPREAALSFRDAVNLDSTDALAYHNLAQALMEIGEIQSALMAANAAIDIDSEYSSAYCIRADIFKIIGKSELALADYDRALLIKPANQAAISGRVDLVASVQNNSELNGNRDLEMNSLFQVGLDFYDLNNFGQAKKAFQLLFDRYPQHPQVIALLAKTKMGMCDWGQSAGMLGEIKRRLMIGIPSVAPFDMLALASNSAIHRQAAELYFQDVEPLLHSGVKKVFEGKIKIAYVAAEFYEHATAYLMAEVLELHDKNRFEIYALSFGPVEKTPMRDRVGLAVNQFIDISNKSDAEVVAWIVSEGVDILVDLKGITKNCRPLIFISRPAPVVVNYLGYPGTLGSSAYDYILGDPVVTPFGDADCYIEKIVQLPHSYQANDRHRKVAPYLPSRSSQGLPESGFVFAAFNNSYKITPLFFDIWMRLLKRVPGSVLWLLGGVDEVERNLCKEALARGVESNRLVFASRLPNPTHLARQRLADLFLDTLPYNAHTTASDALWVGLPVLTCLGDAFAGRVAASLLTAVGLPEMITHSLSEYEAKALWLAAHPEELADIKAKLDFNRNYYPLFDAPRFTANLEKAYERMYARASRGLHPEAFAVEDLAPFKAVIPHSVDSPVLFRG